MHLQYKQMKTIEILLIEQKLWSNKLEYIKQIEIMAIVSDLSLMPLFD